MSLTNDCFKNKRTTEDPYGYLKERIVAAIERKKTKFLMMGVLSDTDSQLKAIYEGGYSKFVNVGFLQILEDVFVEEELNLIKKVCDVSERARLGFAYFAAETAGQRVYSATEMQDYQISKGRSLREYHKECEVLARTVFAEDDDVDSIASVAKSHRLVDVVIGDMPSSSLDETEQMEIKRLAMKLITTNEDSCVSCCPIGANIQHSFDIYNGNFSSEEDPQRREKTIHNKVNDCVMLEMAIRILKLEPQKSGFVWNTFNARFNTEQARHYLSGQCRQRPKALLQRLNAA